MCGADTGELGGFREKERRADTGELGERAKISGGERGRFGEEKRRADTGERQALSQARAKGA